MKLNVPADILKAAILCTQNGDKATNLENVLFELGETGYRIVSTNRNLLFVADLPFTKADDIDDCDLVTATLELKGDAVKEINEIEGTASVEFEGNELIVNGRYYPSVQDNSAFLVAHGYRQLFPLGKPSGVFPLILPKMLESLFDVAKVLDVDYKDVKAYTFGYGKAFMLDYGRAFILAMPARGCFEVSESAVDYRKLFEKATFNLTEW